jgi:hypothetical protein
MRHLDEGTIHAWLDGALGPEDAAGLSVHLENCAECRDRVVEARGLIAGSARILAALDGAASGIVPPATEGTAAAGGVSPRPVIARRRPSWFSRPLLGAAAALLVVVSGTILVRLDAGAPAASSEVMAIPKYPSPSPTLLPDSLRHSAREAVSSEAADNAAASEQPRRAESAMDAEAPPVGRNALSDSVAGKVLNEQAQLSRDLAIERRRAAVQSDSFAARVGAAKSAAGMGGNQRREFAEPPRKAAAVAAEAAPLATISSSSRVDTCYTLEYEGMRGVTPARLPRLVVLRETAANDTSAEILTQRYLIVANTGPLMLDPRESRLTQSADYNGGSTGEFSRAANGVLEFAWRDGANTVRVTLPPADSTTAAAARVGEAVSAGENGAAVWSARARAVKTTCDIR